MVYHCENDSYPVTEPCAINDFTYLFYQMEIEGYICNVNNTSLPSSRCMCPCKNGFLDINHFDEDMSECDGIFKAFLEIIYTCEDNIGKFRFVFVFKYIIYLNYNQDHIHTK